MNIPAEDLLICPICKKPGLIISISACTCPCCKKEFKRLFRIIDFEPSIDFDDKRISAILLDNYDKSFQQLLEIKYGSTTNSLKKRSLWIDKNLLERNKEKCNIINELTKKGSLNSFLELGCGLGSAIHGMARIATFAVGVDISLASLLLANKVLEENGVNNVLLVRSSVEKLPLRDDSFELIFSTDVIEHIPDQSNFVRTACDKLKQKGSFVFNSPNRYSLFASEPHVKVWFMGFLPRRLMDKYVYFVRKIHYTGKRLLSYAELKSIVKKSGCNHQIKGLLRSEIEGVSKNKIKREVVKSLPFTLFILNNLFKYFLPNYNVVITKE